MTGRRYIGCEIDDAMAQKARDRLAGFLFAGAAGVGDEFLSMASGGRQ